MKTNPKSIVVLILALVLALSAFNGTFSEEIAPQEAQPNAFGAEGRRIVLLISDDENDTVPEDHLPLVTSAVSLFASVFAGTDSTLTIQPISANSAPTELELSAGNAAEAIEQAFNEMQDATSDKLDSQLCAKMSALNGTGEPADCIIFITNGAYLRADGSTYNKYDAMSLPLTLITLDPEQSSDRIDNMRAIAHKFGGDSAQAVNLANPNALTLANQMLLAAGAPEVSAYAIPAEAEGLMHICGYLAVEAAGADAPAETTDSDAAHGPIDPGSIDPGARFTAEGAEGDRIVVGAVKDDISLSIRCTPAEADAADGASPRTIRRGDPVHVEVAAPAGLALTWSLNGTEISPDESGNIPTDALDDGAYTLSLTGTCAELDVSVEAEPFSFVLVSPPVFNGVEKIEASDTPDEPTAFVTSIHRDDAFVNDDGNVTAEVVGEDTGFTASFNADGYLTITGTPASADAMLQVKLASQNSAGMTAEQQLELMLHYFPATIADMQLVATPDRTDWYMEGDPITVFVALDDASAALIRENPAWAASVQVKDTSGNSLEQAEDGSGWIYATTAAADMSALCFYINDGATPACAPITPTVHAAKDLTANLIKDSTLSISGPDNAYALNAAIEISIHLDNLTVLQNAPDWTAEAGKIAVTCTDASGEAVRLEGDPEGGWSFTSEAHESTSYTFALSYNDAAEAIHSQTVEVHVEPAPFYIHLACMLNGKADWEFDDANGVLRSPDMLRLYIAAGILLLLLIILIVVIKASTKQRFRENASIEITVKAADRSYEGRPVELEPWGKKTVSFGALVSSSALPPMSLLMDSGVMNKITFRPVRGGVRISNRSERLSGGDREVLTRQSSVVHLSGDQNISVIIRYK